MFCYEIFLFGVMCHCKTYFEIKTGEVVWLLLFSVFFNGTKKKINGRVAFEIYPACVNSKNILSFYSEDLICEGERALASKKEEVRLVPGTNVLKIKS